MRYFKRLNDFILLKESIEEDVLKYTETFPVKLTDSEKSDLIEAVAEMKDFMKKTPGYILPFAKMYAKNTVITLDDVRSFYDELIKYRILIPNLPKNVIEYTDFEPLKDDFDALIIKQKAKEIANELPSFLKSQLKEASEDNQKKFYDLAYSLYIRKDKNAFILSISKYKTLEDMMINLENFISNEFSYSAIMAKIEDTEGAKLFKSDENTGLIIAKIYNYEASKKLGAPSWCIVTNEWSWKTYNSIIDSKTLAQQYFIWNTNKDITDPHFQIGVTINLNKKGSISYKEICDKMNTGMTSSEMFKTCGLKKADLPGPTEEDFNEKLGAEPFIQTSILQVCIDYGYTKTFKKYFTEESVRLVVYSKSLIENIIKQKGNTDIFEFVISNPEINVGKTVSSIRDTLIISLRFDLLDILRKYYPQYSVKASEIPFTVSVENIEKLLSYVKKEKGEDDKLGNSSREKIISKIAVTSVMVKNIESLKYILDKGFNIMTDNNGTVFDEALDKLSRQGDDEVLKVVLPYIEINAEFMWNVLFYYNKAFTNIYKFMKLLNMPEDQFMKLASEASEIQLQKVKSRSNNKTYYTEKAHLMDLASQLAPMYGGKEHVMTAFKPLTDHFNGQTS